MSPSSQMRADVVVVGGGVVGASIAHHLAAAGSADVLLCEQGIAPGQGATSRSGGLLRLHHTAHCDTRLAARSLPVFQNWQDTVGGECGYRRTGFVMLVAEKYAESLRRNSAAVEESGGRSELIDPVDLTELYPGLGVDGVGAAAYEPEGGYADPVAAAGTLLAAARRRGARVADGMCVRRLLTTGDRISGVETNLGEVSAPVVVLASGAWSGRDLAGAVGVTVEVAPRRIGLALAAVPGAGNSGAGLPTCIDDTTGTYFRPSGNDGLYFGVPSHPAVSLGTDVEPLTPDEVSAAKDAVATRVKAVGGAELLGSKAGFDGYTPDRRPLIGPAGPDGLYLATGFSGGGFKTAPAVGELVAAELLGGAGVAGRAEEPLLTPYRPGRFVAGRPVVGDFTYERM
ncbi:FAD-binding oxidoreductase [Streptomyces sp. CB03238]|uniref:NAD(P)/FAD-dependent oxidoreductase n=1 Tax=Streptomyces sp. CB03238 TaxID=1907777 RepID=UPI0011812AAE|nr:FAD-binding oxidoreductase [Streptomyces sp. CB03238]